MKSKVPKKQKDKTALAATHDDAKRQEAFLFALYGPQASLLDDAEKIQVLEDHSQTDLEMAEFFGFC